MLCSRWTPSRGPRASGPDSPSIGGLAKRVDTYATARFHAMNITDISDLDLPYTPPLGSPWDAVQAAAQEWERSTRAGRRERLSAHGGS
ncbi:hypothetical protein [Streptomyces sp. NPDC057617]|uniref:hypothetical protein n=1 Tax=Streptomyces sp. NPDC057617 TaxID=3346184 RepID=UPI00368D6F79